MRGPGSRQADMLSALKPHTLFRRQGASFPLWRWWTGMAAEY